MKFIILDKDQVDQVHLLARSYEKKSSDSGDYVAIPHGFGEFWQYSSFNFEKLSISGITVLVNRWRKDIKVTSTSFSLHSGRFTVERKEYGNKLFSCFYIFIYVSLNFT